MRRRRARVYKSVETQEIQPHGLDEDHEEQYESQKEPIPMQEMYTPPSELTGPTMPIELSGVEQQGGRSELG